MPEWRSFVLQRLAGLGIPPEDELAIVEELAQHIEDRYADLLGRGVPEHEALGQSLEELGGEDLQDELMDVLRRE